MSLLSVRNCIQLRQAFIENAVTGVMGDEGSGEWKSCSGVQGQSPVGPGSDAPRRCRYNVTFCLSKPCSVQHLLVLFCLLRHKETHLAQYWVIMSNSFDGTNHLQGHKMNKLCGRPPQYALPLQIDLLTLKVVSRVTWATSVTILVPDSLFSTYILGPMYARQTPSDVRRASSLNASPHI